MIWNLECINSRRVLTEHTKALPRPTYFTLHWITNDILVNWKITDYPSNPSFISLSLSIYPSIHLSIHPSFNPPTHPTLSSQWGTKVVNKNI